MLVRTFRLTDKLSNATLKLLLFVSGFLLGRMAVLRHRMVATVVVVGATGLRIGQDATQQTQQLSQRLSRVTQRGAAAASERQEQLRQVMVQRAEERRLVRTGDLEAGKVVEDPMLVRNRSLSAFVVILLVVLIGFLLFEADAPPTARLSDSPGGGGIIPQMSVGDDDAPVIPTPTATSAPETGFVSDVGGTLIFSVRRSGQEDIWALPVGSSQPTRMTDSPEDDRHPAWSPDGERVAFTSRRDGHWNLYILDLAQGQTQQLTFTEGYVGAPAWSPDGAFLAFEGYDPDTENIDIFIISADGQEGPFPVTRSPFPDLEPAWAPNGREIAYVGWRNGNRDILVINLDGQPEAEALNLTDTPTIAESAPAWSPDGARVAYTANVDGVEGIYIQPLNQETPARLIGRGRMPTWNPFDGSSVFYTIPQARNAAIYLAQVDAFGVGANAIAFDGDIADLDWTATLHNLAGFEPQTPPLYVENITELPDGTVGLALLNNVEAPQPVLSDAVNDSFEAMRQRIIAKTGVDLLSNLESAYWEPERVPEPGQERLNWHYTGRAIALDRNLPLSGDPAPLAILREDTELGTAWRVMARVAESAQDGSLGEPLRALPWDFASRFEDDPEARTAGGRQMRNIPAGYYVDLTQLLRDFGWQRGLAARNWRAEYSGVRFWEFTKSDGLDWEAAMLEIYTPAELSAFLNQLDNPVPTPLPSPTATITDFDAPPGSPIPGDDVPPDATPLDINPPTALPSPTNTPPPGLPTATPTRTPPPGIPSATPQGERDPTVSFVTATPSPSIDGLQLPPTPDG